MNLSRLISISLWGIIALLIVPLYLRIAWDDPVDYARGGMGARDFKSYYIASKLLEQGQDIYSPDLQKQEMRILGLPEDDTFYVYPTIFSLVLMPLANLDLPGAARVWNTINIILVGVALFLLTRALELNRHLGRHYPWFIILFSISYPVTLSLRAGQANMLILFCLALALFAVIRSLPSLTGFALTIPILTKIFAAGFLLWLLWKKHYRSVIYCIIATAGIIALSNLILFLTGRGNTSDLEYFGRVLPGLFETASQAGTQSLKTANGTDLFSQWILLGNHSIGGFFNRFGLSPNVSQTLTILFSVIIFLATWRAIGINRRVAIELEFGAVLAMLLLVSSLTWESTLALLVVPFAALLKAGALRNYPRQLMVLLVVAFLFLNEGRLWSVIDTSILLASPWLMAFPFLGTVLIWYACLAESRNLAREKM